MAPPTSEKSDDDCSFRGNILIGQGVQDIDETKSKIFICHRESYTTISTYICHSSVVQSGEASSYLYIGKKCCIVWELRRPEGVGSYESSPSTTDTLWFAVKKTAGPSIDKLVSEQLNYQVHEDWFLKKAVHGNDNDEEHIIMHGRKILVAVITAIARDFPCVPFQDSNNTHSKVYNAVDASRHIRISLKGITDKESFFKNLWSFYKSEKKYSGGNVNAKSGTTSLLSSEAVDRNIYHAAEVTPPDLTISSIEQVDEFHINKITHMKIESEYESIDSNADTISSSERISCCNNSKIQLGGGNPSQTVVTKPVGQARKHKDRCLLLECPMCGMIFRSHRNMFARLVSHIKQRHSEREKDLVRVVHRKYYCKGCSDCRK